MNGSEKRVHGVRIWMTDSQFMTVTKLAYLDDRPLGDYLNHMLSLHLFGHEYRLQAMDDDSQKANRVE